MNENGYALIETLTTFVIASLTLTLFIQFFFIHTRNSHKHENFFFQPIDLQNHILEQKDNQNSLSAPKTQKTLERKLLDGKINEYSFLLEGSPYPSVVSIFHRKEASDKESEGSDDAYYYEYEESDEDHDEI
ncbi:hypothetical protein AB834_06435 [PVC group bacterium (ex Bugula neritina AB1)]|nr:hypothetical protein AB834_06435 [PVC group bacterium (ex Bugula neritina AB1)]